MKVRIYGCHSSDSTAGTARFDNVEVKLVDNEITSVASAATVDLNKVLGNKASITGTTGITAVTLAEGREVAATFTGALTITTGASLICPRGQNIKTAAGDTIFFRGEASGVVRVIAQVKTDTVANFYPGSVRYLFSGNTAPGSFDVATNVTENTFESVGPTGSGATNIYTDMDSIPANAKAAIFTFINSCTASGAGFHTLDIFGRQTGSTLAVGSGSELFGYANNPGAGNATGASISRIDIPLDTSNRCDITWTATGDSGRACLAYCIGFVL
jgi:hypothetical protein